MVENVNTLRGIFVSSDRFLGKKCFYLSIDSVMFVVSSVILDDIGLDHVEKIEKQTDVRYVFKTPI